jgi:hypothetical protein
MGIDRDFDNLRDEDDSPVDCDRSIKNEQGVPIWVRANCKCKACNYLRELEASRNKGK